MQITIVSEDLKKIMDSILRELQLTKLKEVNRVKFGNFRTFIILVDLEPTKLTEIEARKMLMAELRKYESILTPVVNYFYWSEIMVLPAIHRNKITH